MGTHRVRDQSQVASRAQVFDERRMPSGSDLRADQPERTVLDWRAVAIFISYRRKDSIAIAGRIDDRLRAEFGKVAVFRDIDNIPPGANFVQHLENALEACDLLIAIIG